MSYFCKVAKMKRVKARSGYTSLAEAQSGPGSVCFANALCEKTDFRGADLYCAIFQGARLQNCAFGVAMVPYRRRTAASTASDQADTARQTSGGVEVEPNFIISINGTLYFLA